MHSKQSNISAKVVAVSNSGMKSLHNQYNQEWGAEHFQGFKSTCLKMFISQCKLLEEETKPNGFLAKVATQVPTVNHSNARNKTELRPMFAVGGHKTSRILDELLKINKKVGTICPHAEGEILMKYSTFKR